MTVLSVLQAEEVRVAGPHDPYTHIAFVDGVGYGLTCFGVDVVTKDNTRAGWRLEIHIHTHYRESEPVLFGFEDRAARDMFRHLLGVRGIGPKQAMAVVAEFGVKQTNALLASGEPSAVKKIKGIGKKAVENLAKLKPLYPEEEDRQVKLC